MLETDLSDEEIEKQHLAIQAKFRITAGAAFFVLVFGAVFYHLQEGLRWVDSFYFCTITLTTVGYGDITPHTDAGKLFTMFYVLVGVGILATFANLFIQNAVGRRQIRLVTKIREFSHFPKKEE